MVRKSFLATAAAFVVIGLVIAQTATAADFSKATYRGKPAECPKGTFYDPRKGGECWSCPSRMKRTILPVTAQRACKRPAYSTWRSSKKHRQNTRIGQGCPRGQFWDVKGGKGLLGACYSCPKGFRRSASSVTSQKACRNHHKAAHARAKFVKKHGCTQGSFRDPRRGGECWACPARWHRTINPVTNAKACSRRLGGILSADTSGLCKTVLGAVRAGATGAQKLNKKLAALTAPITKPIQAVMKRVVPPIESPKALNKLLDKAAVAMGPYQPVQNELRRVGTIALRNPSKLGGILLNPRLMCEGNKKQIMQALIKAGLNPHFKARRASLMDGLLIPSAHAATGSNRTFHSIFISSGTREAGKPVGLALGVTLVTDFRDHLRLYYSFPSVFVSRFAGYEFTAGYMIFPWTNIESFEQINNLGVEISIGRGQSAGIPGTKLEKVMNKWPSGLGFNVSFDPAFVKNPKANVPGFGVSWSWGDEPGPPKPGGKVKSLSPSMSVDWTFRLRKK